MQSGGRALAPNLAGELSVTLGPLKANLVIIGDPGFLRVLPVGRGVGKVEGGGRGRGPGNDVK